MGDPWASAVAQAERSARASYGKLVAILSARLRDVAAAEDALSDAFSAALAQWPQGGVPREPEAWLLAVARRRTTDALRRRRTADRAADHLRLLAEEVGARQSAGPIPDERLRLMFACAHPAVDPSMRAPLILQTILGLDATAIGSAFLIAPSTMGQRLVRAKARLREAHIPFAMPEPEDVGPRLASVLDAVYAAFSEGWTDADGTDGRRRNLAGEAIWLGRVVVSLLPGEPEALGLLALMLFAEARRPARRSVHGRYVPLAEQDPGAWDAHAIDEAETLLRRAARLGRIGRFQIEAAIQSAHCARRFRPETDWQAIAGLYEALWQLAPSPVVAVNRAAALTQAGRLDEGEAWLARSCRDVELAAYQPYWATRAELAARRGDWLAAGAALEKAIGLERDPAVRAFLIERKTRLDGASR